MTKVHVLFGSLLINVGIFLQKVQHGCIMGDDAPT